MAKERVTFTVTVEYNPEVYLQSGFLIGRVRDWITSQNEDEEHYQIVLGESAQETDVDRAFRLASDAFILQFNWTEGRTDDTTRSYGDRIIAAIEGLVTDYAELAEIRYDAAYTRTKRGAAARRLGLK